MNDFGTGTLLCVITAIFFGSFTSLRKLPSVMSSGIRPEIFNLYYIIGVMIISLLTYIVCLILGWETEFTWLGIVSGICLVLVGFFAFLAVPRIGVSATPLIAGPTSMITSIIESLVIGQEIRNWWLTLIGFILVIGGGSGIVLLKPMMGYVRRVLNLAVIGRTDSFVSVDAIVDGHVVSGTQEELTPLKIDAQEVAGGKKSKYTDTSRKDFMVGVVCAMMHGVMMASVPLPTLFTDDKTSGIKFLGSMAVGCLTVFVLTFFILASTEGRNWLNIAKQTETWKLSTCLIPGLLSGMLWNTGNVAGIYAFQYMEFFLVVSFVQCNAIISEIYGILCFRELTNKLDIVVFVLCSFIIVGGCVLLAIGVYQ